MVSFPWLALNRRALDCESGGSASVYRSEHCLWSIWFPKMNEPSSVRRDQLERQQQLTWKASDGREIILHYNYVSLAIAMLF